MHTKGKAGQQRKSLFHPGDFCRIYNNRMELVFFYLFFIPFYEFWGLIDHRHNEPANHFNQKSSPVNPKLLRKIFIISE
jgi:hypothetical protein